MTPLLTALAAAVAALLIVAAIHWRFAPRPRPQHLGATKDWSALAEIGGQPLTGHALDPPPTLAATHAELAAIGDALVVFSRNVEAALWEFMQPLDAETLGHVLAAREWADNPATGELDRVALEALLAEGREVACRP